MEPALIVMGMSTRGTGLSLAVSKIDVNIVICRHAAVRRILARGQRLTVRDTWQGAS